MVRLPLDKSWIKCLTLLGIRGNGFRDKISTYLNNFPENEMSDDVKACRDLLNAYDNDSYYLPVGNFRSLAVGVEVMMRQYKDRKYKILMGTQLRKRKLHDPNSTQSSSAYILNSHKVIDVYNQWENRIMPYHCKIALDALVSYEVYSENYKTYNPKIYRIDSTIQNQFHYFINKLQGNDIKLKINSAEDVPLAVAMGEMTLEEASKSYPQLVNHETNRIEEMKNQFTNDVCMSTDHRIVMARAMKDVIEGNIFVRVYYPESVNKSFPMFWSYLKEIRSIYGD